MNTFVNKCKEQGISIVSTPFNTYQTSQQIVQAVPVEYVMIKGDIKTFSTDDTLDYMKEVMSETRYRGYPVIDLNNRCVGSISRFALLKGLRKKSYFSRPQWKRSIYSWYWRSWYFRNRGSS